MEIPAHQAGIMDRARKGASLVVRGMVLNVVLGLIKVGGGYSAMPTPWWPTASSPSATLQYRS